MASTSVVFDILARDRASDKFDHLGNAVDGSSSKMSKFTGVMKTAGKAAALGLGAGLVLAAGAAGKFTQAAAEDETAASKLEGALKRNADATGAQVEQTEKWISAQGRALGVTDDDLRPALGALVTATHDVSKAQELASLAMDVSAARGKSLQTVSEALMKAQNGNVAALSKLGINTKNAAGETITMEQATKRMADQFGGAAAANAGTLQGKMDRLKLIFSETGESLGAKLIPVVTKFADWVMVKVVPAIEKFVQQMHSGKGAGGDFADNLQKVKGVLTQVGNVLVSVGKFLLSHQKVVLAAAAAYVTYKGALLAVNVATKAVSAVTKAYAAVQWLLNAALTANPIGLVVVGVAALAAGIFIAYKKSETFRTAVNKVWEFLRKFIGFTPFGVLIAEFGVLKSAVSGAVAMVKSLWDWINKLDLGKLGDIASKAGDVLGSVLPKQILAGVKKNKHWIWEASHFVANQFADVLTEQFNNARSALADLRSRRNDFADFSGFRGNLFGADITGGTEGTGPTGVAALSAFAKAQRAQAETLAQDVTKLVGMGLSQSLIEQLKASGSAGVAQIHALAGASPQEVAAINADMAAAAAANAQAGNAAAINMDRQLSTMSESVSHLASLIQAYVNTPVPMVLTLQLEGKTVRQTLLAHRRNLGNINLGFDSVGPR